MEIITVKEIGQDGYLVNGAMSVPKTEGNRHYRMILDWIALGNTPEPEFTALELQAMQVTELKQQGESITVNHIQSVIDAYNDAHSLSFRDVHSCANYKDMTGYTHQQFCIDVWNFNVAVWEELRNVIMPSIDFANPPTEAEFISMLPVYNGVV